jgi:hypothetical protein
LKTGGRLIAPSLFYVDPNAAAIDFWLTENLFLILPSQEEN